MVEQFLAQTLGDAFTDVDAQVVVGGVEACAEHGHDHHAGEEEADQPHVGCGYGGVDFAFGGLKQANGAASPAISSLLLPAPLGSAATMALNWGVQGGGSSTKEGCRLTGQAERYGIARSLWGT